MNAEYLLDAIGRLDDDLVQEAERYRRPKARYGWLLGFAASFAVVLLLGYGVTHFGMGGGAAPGGGNNMAPTYSGGGNGGGPARDGDMAQGGYSETNTPSGAEGDRLDEAAGLDAPAAATPTTPGGSWYTDSGNAKGEMPYYQPESNRDATIELNGEELKISLGRDGTGNRHTFRSQSGERQVLDELPEGCVEILRLEYLGENEEPDVPYINSEEFAGCPVWLLIEDPETAVLYVGLPEGGYLEFR